MNGHTATDIKQASWAYAGSHTFKKTRYTHTPGSKMTNTIPKGAKKIKLLYFPITMVTQGGTIPVYTCCLSVPTGLTWNLQRKP